MVEGSFILDAVLGVFTDVGAWFPTFVDSITGMFWVPATGDDAGYLTFFGVLAIAGLSISVIFLVIGVISNFLHFRG